MFQRLAGEAQRVLDNAVELLYFMRGAVTYEEMMARSPGERQAMGKFVEKHIKNEGKKPNPNY